MIRNRKPFQIIVRWLIVFSLFWLLPISTEQAYACSCAPPDPPDVSLGRATAVFSGKVTDIATPSSFPRVAFNSYYPFVHLYSDIGTTKITFTVTEVWRGEPYEMIIINTSSSGASCGLEGVSVGAEWMVYAYGEQELLSSGLCTRTRPLANASEDLTILGTGNAPTLPGANEPEPASLLGWAVGSCTAVLALTTATFLLVKRRRAQPKT
jgi:hypothetical protein